MSIQFLNVDLIIESVNDLQVLVDELKADFSLSIHDVNHQGNNFAVFSHRSAFDNYELNHIISLFCASLKKMSPEAREIWNSCLRKTFDAGFESGESPTDFQSQIQPETIKQVAEFDVSIAITIYPFIHQMTKVILLDIEGTTTPIDFVHKTLFPYAKAKISDYITHNFAEIQTEIAQLKVEYKKDFSDQLYGRDFREDSPETITNYLNFLIDADRKSTPLKSLQGKIWQSGYESGELKSVMYEDVSRSFKRWTDSGKTLAIFSSGSVLAQKLIFKYSNYGDLTEYISDYFDTNVGGKREAESYRQIASSTSFPQVENFLFISDVVAELDAARAAGMQTVLSVRRGNQAIEEETAHRIIQSFDEIE